MEGHVFKRFAHTLQANGFHCTQIVFPKELRIRQTREQHFLVARQNGRAIIDSVPIGHGHELFNPPACRIAHREKLLMFAHGGLQNLGRQIQKIRRNIAHQYDRPFNQSGNFGQKPFVLNHFKAQRKSLRRGIRPNVIGAFTGIQNHKRPLQAQNIVVKRRNLEPRWRHKPVAFGAVSCHQMINDNRYGFHPGLIGKNAQDRLQWPHPTQAAAAPTHAFGPREIADRGRHHLGHHVRGSTPRFVDHRKK